jgi:hypothetical protein
MTLCVSLHFNYHRIVTKACTGIVRSLLEEMIHIDLDKCAREFLWCLCVTALFKLSSRHKHLVEICIL